MSHIGKNIRKIRTVKKMSQSAFAELFKLTRASIGAYEEGRAEPKIDTIVSIAKYFSISIDRILTKELTINEIYNFDIFKDKLLAGGKGNKSPQKQNQFIHLVTTNYYNEYITKGNSKEFIERLPKIQFPNLCEKKNRIFEHQGCDMHKNEFGLFHGDLLFTEKTNCLDMDKSQIDKFFVVVTKKRLFVRRLDAITPKLTFTSKNGKENRILLSADEIVELWQLVGVYTTHFKTSETMETRISELEKNINKIQNLLNLKA